MLSAVRKRVFECSAYIAAWGKLWHFKALEQKKNGTLSTPQLPTDLKFIRKALRLSGFKKSILIIAQYTDLFPSSCYFIVCVKMFIPSHCLSQTF